MTEEDHNKITCSGGKCKNPLIRTNDLVKSFNVGDDPYEALKGVSIRICEGDFTIIYGASGSGKSTLLNCLIGLEPPTSGEIWVSGKRVDLLDDDERAELRSSQFGIVHQQPIWVKALTVLENVALPLLIEGVDSREAYNKARKVLEEVEMMKYAKHRPTEISGGQQQRVSLARALVNEPKVLFLDEPTGNLDTHASDQVMGVLASLNTKGITIILITHNLTYLPYASCTILIKDGLVDGSKESSREINEDLSKELK